jgi:hypothetical protein
MKTTIERAILAARAVAATDEAKRVARTSRGRHGVWSASDEKALRQGRVRTEYGDIRLPVEAAEKWFRDWGKP